MAEFHRRVMGLTLGGRKQLLMDLPRQRLRSVPVVREHRQRHEFHAVLGQPARFLGGRLAVDAARFRLAEDGVEFMPIPVFPDEQN